MKNLVLAALLIGLVSACSKKSDNDKKVTPQAVTPQSIKEQACEKIKNYTDSQGYTFYRCDDEDMSSFFLACVGHSTDLVGWYLDSGVDVNLRWESTEGKSAALHIAALNLYQDMAEMLLKRGADVNKKDENGATPLLTVVRHSIQDQPDRIRMANKMIQFLIDSGANPNAHDNNGNTALIRMAAVNVPPEVLLNFIRSNKNLNLVALNNRGESALSHAQTQAMYGYPKNPYNYEIIKAAIQAVRNGDRER